MSRSITYFEPHSAIMNDVVIELTDYYDFDKPGKFKIVVLRVICASWDKGALRSATLKTSRKSWSMAPIRSRNANIKNRSTFHYCLR